MEANNRLDLLKSLKSLLVEQKITNCRLVHETTLHDRNSHLPIISMIGNEKRYKRLGLCPEPKNQHLGCAHTNYRITLGKKIIKFVEVLPDLSQRLNDFHIRVKELEMEVITTDIQKSGIEANIAKARENQCDLQELRALSNNTSDQHTAINNKIKAELNSLITEIDQKIKLEDSH